MTRVLLITDTERVQRIFESLETKGLLQLKIVATLIQGDLEISASTPDFTFVQSRISGFSGDILLRHLGKTLPDAAKIVLLTGDADDAAQAKLHAGPFLDLTLDDEALADAVIHILTGVRRSAPKKRAKGQAASAGKGSAAKAKKVAALPVPVVEEPEATQETVTEEAIADVAVRGRKKQLTEEAIGDVAMRGRKKQLAEEPEADLAEPKADLAEPEHQSAEESPDDVPVPPPRKAPESFEAIMRRASEKAGTSESAPLEAEDRVDVAGKPVPASPRRSDKSIWNDGEQPPEPGPVPDDVVFRGEPLADAMLRAQRKKRVNWIGILPFALGVILIPLFFYLAGKQSATPPSSPAPDGVSRPDRPSVKGSAAAKPPEPTPEPTAAPAAKGGLKTLPPFLADAKPDARYGKTHPGWSRYVGAKTEYKVFREADRYRAIQVIALGGETISDQLFKRVLLEFGGADSYRVQSIGKKGDYVAEHGVAKGGVALTIYRTENDLKMKALVLYYP